MGGEKKHCKRKKKRRADARRSQQREGGRQKGERIARRWREDCKMAGRGLREDCERTVRVALTFG